MTAEADERTRIIDAAYRCLTARDGATVPVTDILAEAGLSTRAFYRHFASKDSLLLAMFRRDSDRVMGQMDAIVAAAASPPDALREFIQGTLWLTSDTRRRQRIMILISEEAQRARGYAAERARAYAAQERTIIRVLRQGLADGSFPWARPEADARPIRAAMNQAFEEQMSRSAPVTAAEAADRIIDFALRALGAAAPDGMALAPRLTSQEAR